MIIFIDDSGDGGFKFEKGSSKFFIIAAVIFDDNLEAEKAAVAIKELRRALNFSDHVEFKFNKSRRDIREKFFKAITKFNFRIRSIIVDKRKIYSRELKTNHEKFLSFVIKNLLKNSNNTIRNASIKIDGCGGREFRRLFVAYIRRELNNDQKKIVKSCKLVDSRSNVLIQMADMIAGATRVSYEKERTDYGIYKKIFRNKIEDEWQFK